jgi:hypothetical protein
MLFELREHELPDDELTGRLDYNEAMAPTVPGSIRLKLASAFNAVYSAFILDSRS